jgi:hypothetical protein
MNELVPLAHNRVRSERPEAFYDPSSIIEIRVRPLRLIDLKDSGVNILYH